MARKQRPIVRLSGTFAAVDVRQPVSRMIAVVFPELENQLAEQTRPLFVPEGAVGECRGKPINELASDDILGVMQAEEGTEFIGLSYVALGQEVQFLLGRNGRPPVAHVTLTHGCPGSGPFLLPGTEMQLVVVCYNDILLESAAIRRAFGSRSGCALSVSDATHAERMLLQQ